MINYLLKHYLEITAVLTGLLNVFLAGRASLWNYFFGAISVSLYLFIFYQAKLYADMSLQLIFLNFQFYGWYQWRYGSASHHERAITRLPRIYWLGVITSTLLLYAVLAWVLDHYTDSTTVALDAFTTALSLVAQTMMSKKWLEHWWLWMLVDAIAIPMYLLKSLYLTAGLYSLFFLLCLMGYLRWRALLPPSLHSGNCQSISFLPIVRKRALVLEKCLQPKKPRAAESGEG